MNTTVDVSLTYPAGDASGAQFGRSVASGDFNNDGITDALVGAILDDTSGTDNGSAYIFYGGTSMDTTVDVSLAYPGGDTETVNPAQFGRSVTSGDFNNDGITDALVGADLDNTSGSNNGSAYIFYGGTSMNTTVDVSLTYPGSNASNAQFGYSVTSGDFNNDEITDVLVGAYGDNTSGTDNGSAYIFHGAGSGAGFAAAEDKSISLAKNTTKRLRFLVDNAGDATSSATTYRIEYATSTGASTWTQVAAGNHWEMVNSTYLDDGTNTTNVAGGLTDPGGSFATGRAHDVTNQTAAITLTQSQFTELEYSIQAANSAVASTTYYFRLSDAGTAINVYTVYASATIAGAGVPTVNLTQIHYRWRNNDGDETSATWAMATNTPITGVTKQTVRRLRIEISNEGDATSSAVQYRIEYATSSGASVWTAVGTTSAHWVMIDSQLTDASDTSNVANGLPDEEPNFEIGQQKESSSQTAAITLQVDEFTEIEYAIAATSTAINGETYYFRLSDAGTALNTYSVYASATIAAGGVVKNCSNKSVCDSVIIKVS